MKKIVEILYIFRKDSKDKNRNSIKDIGFDYLVPDPCFLECGKYENKIIDDLKYFNKINTITLCICRPQMRESIYKNFILKDFKVIYHFLTINEGELIYLFSAKLNKYYQSHKIALKDLKFLENKINYSLLKNSNKKVKHNYYNKSKKWYFKKTNIKNTPFFVFGDLFKEKKLNGKLYTNLYINNFKFKNGNKFKVKGFFKTGSTQNFCPIYIK